MRFTDSKFLLFVTSTYSQLSGMRTIRAWQRVLHGIGQVVILSSESTVVKLGASWGVPVACVRHAWNGPVLFDSMIEVATRLSNNSGAIAAIVNADIKPTANVRSAIEFLVRMDVRHQPLRTAKYGNYFKDTHTLGVNSWFAVVNRVNIFRNGSAVVHKRGGYDMFAWTPATILAPDIPPFRIGRGTYDNWLLDIVMQRKNHHVIDMTKCLSLLHNDHLRAHGTRSWYDAIVYGGDSDSFINRYMGLKRPHKASELYLDRTGTTCETPLVCDMTSHLPIERYLERRVRRTNEFCSLSPNCINPLRRCNINRIAQGDRAHMRNFSPSRFKKVNQKWPYYLHKLQRGSSDPVFYFNRSTVEEVFGRFTLRCKYRKCIAGALDRDAYEMGILKGMPVFAAI